MNLASRVFAVVAVLCLCTLVTEADADKTFNKGRLPSESGNLSYFSKKHRFPGRSKSIAEWKVKLTTFSGDSVYVAEHAEVVGDGNQILMFSEDPQLENVYVYRSQSYHDYDTTPGILGIKYMPHEENEGAACFIGETVKDFESTMEDIKPRDGKILHNCHNGKHHRVLKQVTSSGSKKIDEFCDNLPMYHMVQANYQLGLFDIPIEPLKPWWVGTRCIYGDIKYWLVESLDIKDGFFRPSFPI